MIKQASLSSVRSTMNMIVAAIGVATLGATGTTAHVLYAEEAHPCADYICDESSECEKVDCDVCEEPRNRCATNPG